MSADSRSTIDTTFIAAQKKQLRWTFQNPWGNSISTHCFVDAKLSGNLISRRSQTGVLIFCNRAHIIWHSKRNNAVETSTVGSEMMALKNGVELVEALRYNLRTFGAPIEGATNIYCDNEAVYKNFSIPESTLRKKHHRIAYHRNREAVAAVTCRIEKENSKTNLSDFYTKILLSIVREELLDRFMYCMIEEFVVFYSQGGFTPCPWLWRFYSQVKVYTMNV